MKFNEVFRFIRHIVAPAQRRALNHHKLSAAGGVPCFSLAVDLNLQSFGGTRCVFEMLASLQL